MSLAKSPAHSLTGVQPARCNFSQRSGPTGTPTQTARDRIEVRLPYSSIAWASQPADLATPKIAALAPQRMAAEVGTLVAAAFGTAPAAHRISTEVE
jgi:hypothetical protein